jgi:hypothetical protein
MSTAPYRRSRRWTAILAWVLLLLIAGAALATWGLTRWQAAAQFLGVAPEPPPAADLRVQPQRLVPQSAAAADPITATRIAELEARLRTVENQTQRAAGSAGRADALLVSFASRRAIDRGVPLGYLETLLADRFGEQNPHAVATIITASREPVTLDELVAEYESLGPALRRGAPDESLWDGFRREMAGLIAVRRASTPSAKPQARYDRALVRLREGRVDSALAETMRLPGAPRAEAWVGKARRYVSAHRALDEVESAALLSGGR